MELKETLEREKEKIAEALEAIGYTVSGSFHVSKNWDDLSITITIRKEEN